MIDVVQKLWGFCHTLRHDGIDYGDYIEQLTYLLFLKMADERGIDLSKVQVQTMRDKDHEMDCSWPSLMNRSGTDLTQHYVDLLRALGTRRDLLGDIFAGALSRFNNPVNLKKLVGLIDETEWTALETDVKAAAFEGLLEKAASEGKKGAGQYFTPRLLIQALVRCVKPDPRAHDEFTVCDPGCGTGGFLVCAYEWLIRETEGGAIDRELAKRIRKSTYFGADLVPRPRRLALMNLYLHGLEPQIRLGDSIYEAPDSRKFDVVLTNPPFGTKGASTSWVRISNYCLQTDVGAIHGLYGVDREFKDAGYSHPSAPVFGPENVPNDRGSTRDDNDVTHRGILVYFELDPEFPIWNSDSNMVLPLFS